MMDVKIVKFLKIEMIERLLGDDRIKYLVIGPIGLEAIDRSTVTKVMNGEFASMLTEHIHAYIKKGVMPPKEIRTPILNIADDILAGREPVIRAGDYISLQNYRRS